MKNFYYLILLLFIGNSFTVTAQTGKQKKADRLYNDLAYIEAVEVYKDLIENEYNATYNSLKLGDSYMKLRSPENAVFYYGDAINSENVAPEYYFKYAQALRGVKRYDESRQWLQKYREANGTNRTVDDLLAGDIKNFEIADEYSLEAVTFNSGLSDFGAFEKDGKIYFVSARDEGMSKKNKIYSWNGEPFLDIYQLDGETVTPLTGDVNTILHDGPLTITKDGKYMYFNRNNYLNNKQGKRDKENTNHLKIYRATNVNGQWKDIVELPFNNDAYSVGHPALAADEKTLYFASDMPNGFGGTDIYKVEILGDNVYGNPVNLGEQINTSLDESFPFITEYNVLYFSSNGHLGFGLMDIFKADLGVMNIKIENLGAPVNSNMDDFAYFQRDAINTGYFASNRDNGVDNIFGFNLLKPLMLKGNVTDKVNKRPVSNANIILQNENNEQIAFLETDEDGYYETLISRNKQYPIEAKHIEYQEKKGTVNSMDMDDKEELVYNIELDPIEDVEYLAEIDIIYFDFDKHNIRPDAARELDKLVDLMTNKYPELVIEIGSHTDIRGSNQYNEGLAERRAKSTYDYLISKGISADRIAAYTGYGERELAVECERCNKEQHQLNRRSVFKVVKMN
ncbi:OmpA family protein [Antarcticibacterium arcticum]|uniref:OmpA family protein n=1 Tax=Antarcticibacterium arcticum TaxID=2585771 RepID=A0A5B8YID9_9FLAO|nr:OmpA family protein [Antarcticibacterium arcticum]QED36798.1 OmpA family protein [Antarcticibacterium arcticum]